MLDNVLDDNSTCPFAVVILFFMVADEEMYVWYLSTLSEWSQVVLTTNKSKGRDC
jgi:hypothetical protein